MYVDAKRLSIIKGDSRPDFIREETLADLFRSTAAAFPHKNALIFGNEQLNYAQLDVWSDAFAAHLALNGLGRGNKVVVWQRRGIELHVAILAIVKSGATYVPIDSEMPAERVELIIKEVKANACISRFMLNCDCPVFPVTPKPAEGTKVIAPASAQPQDIAYIIYTSGSTGKPKGIPIRQRQICHLVRAENSILGITDTDVVYQGFSVSFDMWCEEVWLSYFAGATLYVADETTAKAIDELSDVLRRQKITVLHAVPSLLAVMDEDVPSIRLINAGGEACSLQVVNKWAAKNRMFYNSYGPTETTVTATISQLKPGDRITIGDPLPNYNVAVVDEQMQLLPTGERGELIITGPGVADGYIDLPELTKQKFIPKSLSLKNLPGKTIYKTGDAAIINEDGSIDFLGRFDDQVKLRGYRIELGEIEARLLQIPNVSAAAVAVKKDADEEDHLVGYVVAEDEVCMDEQAIRVELARILPAYMVPAIIVSLPDLPRMPSGKVNRKALSLPPSLLNDGSRQKQEAIDLNAPLADRMLAVLRTTFRGKNIDLSNDFFTDLGGHSLLAAGFISRLRRDGGVLHASLRDVYTHRPLQALAKAWEKTPQANAPTPRTFHKVPLLRFYSCWTIQSLFLLIVYGLYAIEIFTPFISYYYISEETGSELEGIIAAILFYCLIPPLYTVLAVAIKWLVIGKMKEGDYPLWGAYYIRWWVVKTVQRLIPAQFISGSPLYPKFLSMFGVKVAPDAQLSNITIGAEDLVTIGADASLSSQVVLNNAFVENGLLKLRSIHIGDHAYLGSSTVIAGDCVIKEYGELQDLSYLPAGGVIGEGEVWQGSPAVLTQTKTAAELPKPLHTATATKARYNLYFSLALFLFPFFVVIPLLPIIIAIHALDNAAPDYNFDYVIIVPALALLYILLFAVETIVCTRLLNAGIKKGSYSVYSMRYLRKWLADQLFSLSLIVLHPVYATVYVSWFYRLLGARIGKNTEISTASSVTHPLLQIGSDAFIADAVTLGEADVRAQRLILDNTSVANNSFVGNSALIPQGYALPSNMLIGVLSTPPSAEQMAGNPAKDWFGSPAIGMPARQQSQPFPPELTFRPSFGRKSARSAIEFVRILLPETAIICFSIFFIAYGHDLIVDHPLWEIAVLLPIYYLVFIGIPSFLVTVMLKWLLVGKYKAEQKPMWTLKVWISEAITTTYEALSVTFFLDYLRGTPWLPLLLRLLGTKTGKRVWMNTTDVTEYDMVTIGTDAALNEDCGPQTHLFEDRVMKVGAVEIGERTSIGARSIILFDTRIGNDIKIDALSLVMKGETLAPYTNWTGSPIEPM